MSDQPDDERLEELRQEKLQRLKQQQGQGQPGQGQEIDEEALEAQREQAEAQKKAILRKTLTDGARKRLNSVRMSKPEFAEQVEQQVIALSRSGRLQGKIDEDQMKSLLQELKPESKEFDIRRR